MWGKLEQQTVGLLAGVTERMETFRVNFELLSDRVLVDLVLQENENLDESLYARPLLLTQKMQKPPSR